MADRPILFSAPMVHALLDGRKTQTRRLLPNPEYYGCPTGDCPHSRQDECNQAMRDNTAAHLHFAVGDRLWVKEPWTFINMATEPSGRHYLCVGYGADGAELPSQPMIEVDQGVIDKINARKRDIWQNRSQRGRFMFKALSRLTLLVTDVRVERLNDCSEADAIAEGIHQWRHHPIEGEPFQAFKAFGREPLHRDPRLAYRDLWDSINGPDAWEANPWVVAVTFTVEQRNIDQ